MKILVTGGCGFIGSHTVRLLLQEGYEVVILDDLSTGTNANLIEAIDDLENVKPPWLITGSTTDANLVKKLVSEVDAVMHLAALVSVPKSIDHPSESFNRNMVGFFNVLDAAAFYQTRLVYASSAAVYGAWQGVHHEWRGLQSPLSPYAADKCANEIYGSVFAKQYNFNIVALRYFNVYGPRQDPKSDYAGVIGKFINRGLSGQPITINGDGKQTRNFIYVSDVAKVNVAALLARGGFETQESSQMVVNVGCVSDKNSITINELADIVKFHLPGNLNVPVQTAPATPGDIRHSEPDLTTLKNLLPTLTSNMIQLDAGISDLVRYLGRS